MKLYFVQRHRFSSNMPRIFGGKCSMLHIVKEKELKVHPAGETLITGEGTGFRNTLCFILPPHAERYVFS